MLAFILAVMEVFDPAEVRFKCTVLEPRMASISSHCTLGTSEGFHFHIYSLLVKIFSPVHRLPPFILILEPENLNHD